MEFSKLEKVELGGIKGKMLSHQVVEIFSEFNDIFAVFGNRTYDGLDATNRVCSVRRHWCDMVTLELLEVGIVSLDTTYW